jgi:hypothetical protein
MTRDQAGPMDAAEVAVDERVSGLGAVLSAVREAEVPLGVLLPGVRGKEGVLLGCTGLNVSPIAVEDVLPSVDEPLGPGDTAFVDRVGGDGAL